MDSNIHKQRTWDQVIVDQVIVDLLSRYSKPYHKARLLATEAPHNGDWLCTLPISACGLHLKDNVIRVAVRLRLGCAICETHSYLCGATVDSLGQHALSCKKNASRVQRHAWLNDLIHCALIRAKIQQVFRIKQVMAITSTLYPEYFFCRTIVLIAVALQLHIATITSCITDIYNHSSEYMQLTFLFWKNW